MTIDWSSRKTAQSPASVGFLWFCDPTEHPSGDGIPKARKGQHASQRLTTLLLGGLERGRAAPAEGVHGDEISHEAASPKFEAVWIFAIAAVLVPIAHLAAPLFCCR